MPSQKEIERRFHNIRTAMETEKVDALIVCGNQYAGFEGAVRYTSGFEIVHRYVYVLIPLSGDPVLVFPREARWIGDKKAPFVQEKVWAEILPENGFATKPKNAIGNASLCMGWISSWPFAIIANSKAKLSN